MPSLLLTLFTRVYLVGPVPFDWWCDGEKESSDFFLVSEVGLGRMVEQVRYC